MSVDNGIAGRAYTARVHIVDFPTSADGAADWVEERVKGAGHQVVARESMSEPDALREAVTGGAGAVDVVLFVGGSGGNANDIVPEAVGPLLGRTYPGFGELLRSKMSSDVGATAMWSRAVAGGCGPVAVFAIPGSISGCRVALDQLILPELATLLAGSDAGGNAPKPLPVGRVVPTPGPERSSSTAVSADPPEAAQAVSPRGVSLNMGSPDRGGPVVDDEGVSHVGWRAAIAALEGEMLPIGERVPLPEVLERLAPVANVLHTAGQLGGFKLPSGRKYGLYGWPDLTRPSSKVIAVAEGYPWGSALALHRHPVPTGLCAHVEVWVPKNKASVEDACAQLSERMPKDLSGDLFAVQGNAVWILQGGRVMMWDGRHLKSEGTEKQALARLFLHWSQK